MSQVLFVSDIHSTPRVPFRLERFRRFLEKHGGRETELYLLGDIFEYWIGPKHLTLDDHRPLLDLLRDLTRRGISVSFVFGNRDYLLCREFSEATGVRLLGRQHDLVLGGKKVRLVHGDRLYNRDLTYSIYRSMMDRVWLQKAFMAMPLSLGRGIAASLRSASQRKRTYSYPGTVQELIEPALPTFDEGCDVLICGHIHKPQHVAFERGGRNREIFVLGDWDEGCDYVEFASGRFSLRPFHHLGAEPLAVRH